MSKIRTLTDYDSEISALVDSLLSDSFRYDVSRDPVYKQYVQQYTNLGKRAAGEAYGEAAARTGGYGSSYAATAAAQANNYYMSELANKVPELYQAAYDMYAEDQDRKRSYASLLSSLGSSYYSRALTKAKALAKQGDYSGYKALGYTDGEIRRLQG